MRRHGRFVDGGSASAPRRGLAPHGGFGDPQDPAGGRRTERSFEPHRLHHHRCSGDLARAVATLSERGARPCGRGRLPARLDRARPSDSLRRPSAPRPATRQTSPVDGWRRSTGHCSSRSVSSTSEGITNQRQRGQRLSLAMRRHTRPEAAREQDEDSSPPLYAGRPLLAESWSRPPLLDPELLTWPTGIPYSDLGGVRVGREVFADPLRVERVNRRREYAEERREVVGMVRDQMLFVVYTLRGEVRRLISARRASRNERRAYYAGSGRA